MNKKIELRDVFLKQPAYYFLLDGAIPMSIYQFNKICDVINDLAALAISIRGASRISGLGVYYVWKKPCCSFSMQSLKFNFLKLHYALEDIKCLKESNSGTEPCDPEIWTKCLTDAVKQYEDFMESNFYEPSDWPRLQIVILTHQPLNRVLQAVRDTELPSNIAAIKKIQVIGIMPTHDVVEMRHFEKVLPEICKLPTKEDNKQNSLEHLIEIHHFGSDVLHIEKFIKSLLHDMTNDSEHLRIQFKDDKNVLHCDMQEIFLNPDSITGCSNFRLATDIGTSQIMLPNLKNNSPKVPVYELEAVGLVPTYRTCLNSVYGSSTIISPTTCWKTDWSLLQSNKHFFSAIRELLESRQQLLVVRSKIQSASASTNNVACGYFGVFAPSDRNIMFVKPIGTRELLLPEHPLADYEIPTDMPVSLTEDAVKCLEELTMYDDCNPVYFSSRLGEQLAKTLKKTSHRGNVRKFSGNASQNIGGPSPKKWSNSTQNVAAAKDFKAFKGKHEETQYGKLPLKTDANPVAGKKQSACLKGVNFLKNVFEQPKN